MTRLIRSITALTEGRSRDDLELTLATVIYDLAGPQDLRLWRLVTSYECGQSGPRLRLRCHLEAGRPAIAPHATLDVEELPLLSDYPQLQDCFATRTHQTLAADDRGLHGSLFPVLGERSVAVIVELRLAKPLGPYQFRLVRGLLQIYHNHLKLLDASEHDQLTGLLNRRGFEEQQVSIFAGKETAEPLVERRGSSARGDQSPCLAIIDIDFFKRVNDEFGHLYGDEVLVLLARLIQRCFRDADRLFRFGGEEFVVVLQGNEKAGVHASLERFRQTVEAHPFPRVGRVTVSIGYTYFSAEDAAPDAFGRADKALYVAKAEGRNQVRCYEDLVAAGTLQTRAQLEPEVEYF